MSDTNMPKDDEPSMDPPVGPPPAYSEVVSQPSYAQGTPPPNYMGACPYGDQDGPQPPYSQAFMQDYAYPPSQMPLMAGKHPGMVGAQYACGQYPAGQYPPEQCGYAQGQTCPPPMYMHAPYPAGQYPHHGAYGHPNTTVQMSQPLGGMRGVRQGPPPDNLQLSILACACCFWPTGLIAIVHSCSARAANQANDWETAWKYSNKAKRLGILSVVIGSAIFLFGIVVRLILVPAMSSNSH